MWASVIPVSTSQQCGKDCYSVCVCIVPACHQPSTLASWSAGFPSRFCWSPSAQCVVLVGGAFWRTLSWLGLMLLSQGFHRVSLPCSSCEDMARKGQLSTRKRALTRAQPCWCLELGHLSLQNCEKKKKKTFCLCVCLYVTQSVVLCSSSRMDWDLFLLPSASFFFFLWGWFHLCLQTFTECKIFNAFY